MLDCIGVQTRCVLLSLLFAFFFSGHPRAHVVAFFCVFFFKTYLLYSFVGSLIPPITAASSKPQHSYSDFSLRSSGGTNSNDYSLVGLSTSRPANEKLRVFVSIGRSCMTSTATTKRAMARPSELCGIIPISGYCIATRGVGNDRFSGPSVNLILNIHSAQFFSLF